MCKTIAKNQRTAIFVTIGILSLSLTFAILGLIANLAIWTTAASVGLMSLSFAMALGARGNIWKLLDEFPKLLECLYQSNNDKCLSLFHKIKASVKLIHGLLIVCCILIISAAAISWLPLWGAIAIGVAIAMIGTCLGLIIALANHYTKIINCIV
ncbi:hypothetical protein [Tenacibaculum maritimum]|uniref:hypothetical protein n=1 Tax=Tenacibaculum maritimum TaxID=107401 RepID=UPI001330641D|nr:hypothetical protein [Tenacibaculum maritimum]